MARKSGILAETREKEEWAFRSSSQAERMKTRKKSIMGERTSKMTRSQKVGQEEGIVRAKTKLEAT